MVLLGGLLLQQSASPSEQAEAADLFRRAAAQGNLEAQYNYGVCLRCGLGLARDDAAAAPLYAAAAARGHISAQLAYGTLKAETAATEAEWLEVESWYRKAADGGHPTAKQALAELIERRSAPAAPQPQLAAVG